MSTRPPPGSPEELPWLRGYEAAATLCRERHGVAVRGLTSAGAVALTITSPAGEVTRYIRQDDLIAALDSNTLPDNLAKDA